MRIFPLSVALLASVTMAPLQALEIQTAADGSVVIKGAAATARSLIWLVPASSATAEGLRVPLDRAQGVQVTERGVDLVIRNPGGDGRYRELLLQQVENGGQQSVRINLPQAAVPAAPPGVGTAVTLSNHATNRMPPPPGVMQKPMPLDADKLGKPVLVDPGLVNQALAAGNFNQQDMVGVSIINTRMQNCSFADTRLMRSQLINTEMVQCNLQHSDFSKARLVNVSFEGSDLRGVRFEGAELVNVNFAGARLSGAIWSDGRVCAEGSVGSCG